MFALQAVRFVFRPKQATTERHRLKLADERLDNKGNSRMSFGGRSLATATSGTVSQATTAFSAQTGNSVPAQRLRFGQHWRQRDSDSQ
jgi:hypothetical protein